MGKTEPEKEKRCSKCGGPFGCGADSSSCWCQKYEVSPALLARLRASYDDCLCSACLEMMVEESLKHAG